MATIYYLTRTTNSRPISGLYYNEDDAVRDATLIAMDTKRSVAVWETKEIDGLPVKKLVRMIINDVMSV